MKRISDGAEDNVRALAIGQFADAGNGIALACNDDLDQGVDMVLAAFIVADHPDDARARPGRDLRRRLPDLAVEAKDRKGSPGAADPRDATLPLH